MRIIISKLIEMEIKFTGVRCMAGLSFIDYTAAILDTQLSRNYRCKYTDIYNV